MCEHMRDSGYEAALVRHCLTSYGMPCKPQQQQQQQEGCMDTDATEGSGQLWALQEHKVSLVNDSLLTQVTEAPLHVYCRQGPALKQAPADRQLCGMLLVCHQQGS